MSFAKRAPNLEGSVVRALRARYLRAGYDDEPVVELERTPEDAERDRKLIEHFQRWHKAPPANRRGEGEVRMMGIQRHVRKKRGSWHQVPKDIKDDPDESDA